MAQIVMEEYEEFPTLPADSILHLKIVDVTTRDVPGRTPDTAWTKLELKFKILGIQAAGDGSPVEAYESLIGQHIWGSVPFKLTTSPENRLRQWCEAIFGQELTVGFQLDTDLMNNKSVRGVTSVYDKRKTNPKTGKPFQNHQVESLLPMGGQLPPTQYQQSPAAGGGWGAPAVNAGPLVAPQQSAAPQQPAQQPGYAAVGAPPPPDPGGDPWGATQWGDEPPF